jgi:hypothetical protein
MPRRARMRHSFGSPGMSYRATRRARLSSKFSMTVGMTGR